jgi:hypothetical protein
MESQRISDSPLPTQVTPQESYSAIEAARAQLEALRDKDEPWSVFLTNCMMVLSMPFCVHPAQHNRTWLASGNDCVIALFHVLDITSVSMCNCLRWQCCGCVVDSDGGNPIWTIQVLCIHDVLAGDLETACY